MQATRVSATPCAKSVVHLRLGGRRSTVKVQATSWTKISTVTELKEAGGKKVVEVGGQRVLLADSDGSIFAVSNKCSHMGLPLVGKTAMFQAEISNRCVTCPAHGTKFDLSSGEPIGEWCPTLDKIPFVGSALKGEKRSLPTFQTRVDESGVIEVLA